MLISKILRGGSRLKNKSIPLYVQVAEDLRDNIRIGKWEEGDKIPTEVDLCSIYGVSRITIRKAIDELVKEGLLYRRRAKGTFVANFTEAEDSDNFTIVKGFTEEMKELGEKARTMYASVDVVKADKRLAMYLNTEVGDKVINLKRIRGDSKEAFVYAVTYLTYYEKLSLDSNDYYGSLYAYLSEHNIHIKEDKEVVEAILPNYEVRQALNIGKKEPVLKRTRFTSCKRKNFYEYTVCYYIGKSYKYYLVFD